MYKYKMNKVKRLYDSKDLTGEEHITLQPAVEIAEKESCILEESDAKNMTVSTLPIAHNEIVIAPSPEVEITDDLQYVIDKFKPNVTILPDPGPCPNDYVVEVPRQMVVELEGIMSRLNVCDYNVSNFKHVIKDALTDLGDTIRLTRLFFKALSDAISTLIESETMISIRAAITKMYVTPIALPDAQSTADVEFFESNIEELVDEKTEEGHVKCEPSVLGDIADTIVDAPQTIGLPSPNPIEPSIEKVDLVDSNLEEDEVLEEAHDSLLEIYSAKTLTTPLNLLFNDIEYIWEEVAITATVDGDEGSEARAIKILVPVKNDITVPKEYENKSIIELTEQHAELSFAGSPSAKGIGSFLKKAWNAVKSIKLPSPETIAKGAEILGKGLEFIEENKILPKEKLSHLHTAVDLFKNNEGDKTQDAMFPLTLLNHIPNTIDIGYNLLKRARNLKPNDPQLILDHFRRDIVDNASVSAPGASVKMLNRRLRKRRR